MARQRGKVRYSGRIGPLEFRELEPLIRDVGLVGLVKGQPITRGTLYNWLRADSLHPDIVSSIRARQDRFLTHLRVLDVARGSPADDLRAAASMRQGALRNVLSDWMSNFYGIERPVAVSGRKEVSALGQSNREFRTGTGTGSRQFIEEPILSLPIGSGSVQLIMKPSWCPKRLTSLDALDQANHRSYRRDREKPAEDLWPMLAETLMATFGKEFTYNGFTYDLVSIGRRNDLPVFDFCGGRFFGQVNCGEGLLWELAIAASRIPEKNRRTGDRHWAENLFVRSKRTALSRRLRSRPFEFRNRCVGVGINTLTIFAFRKEKPIFLMHERGKRFHHPAAEEISTEAVNMWHVIPAGGWQPYDDDDAYHEFEFRFASNVLREFCEEVLAKEKLMKSLYLDSPPEKVYSDESDVQLAAAKRLFETGGTSQWYLGCGLDFLTLKLEMMTLLLVDGDRMRAEVAREIPRVNREGLTHQYPFTREELKRMLSHRELLPAGAGCLWFALEHFNAIGSAARRLLSKPTSCR